MESKKKSAPPLKKIGEYVQPDPEGLRRAISRQKEILKTGEKKRLGDLLLEEGLMLSSRFFKQQIEINGNGAQAAAQPGAGQGSVVGGGYITLPPEGISLEAVEKQLIQQAMERFDGNQTQAAKCLHMSRDTLRYHIKKFGLQDVGK